MAAISQTAFFPMKMGALKKAVQKIVKIEDMNQKLIQLRNLATHNMSQIPPILYQHALKSDFESVVVLMHCCDHSDPATQDQFIGYFTEISNTNQFVDKIAAFCFYQLGCLHSSKHDFESAISFFERALAYETSFTPNMKIKAQIALGELYQSVQRYDEAAVSYRDAAFFLLSANKHNAAAKYFAAANACEKMFETRVDLDDEKDSCKTM